MKKKYKNFFIKSLLFIFLLWILIFFIISAITFVFFKTHNEKSSYIFLSSITKENYKSNVIPNNITESLILAIHNLIFFFFINPLAWLINQLVKIILFLGSGNLLNNLMFHNKGLYSLPKSFWILLIISISLSIIFIVYKLIVIMISNHKKQLTIFSDTIKGFILILIFIPLIPTIFYLINQILTIVLYFLMYKNHFMDLSLLIFNSSFLDHMNNINHIPSSTNDLSFTDQTNFSYCLCTVTYISILYVLFHVSKTLIVFIIELLWLFITTIPILFSILGKTNNVYEIVRKHNLIILQNVLIFFSIFLAFNIFSSSIPIIINSIENSNLKLEFSKSILLLIVIFSYAFFILETPLLIFNIIGSRNIINPFNHGKTLFIGVFNRNKKISKGIKNASSLTANKYKKYKSNITKSISNESNYEEQINNNINLKNNNDSKKENDKNYE